MWNDRLSSSSYVPGTLVRQGKFQRSDDESPERDLKMTVCYESGQTTV